MATTYEVRQTVSSAVSSWQQPVFNSPSLRTARLTFEELNKTYPQEHFELFQIFHEEEALDWTGKE